MKKSILWGVMLSLSCACVSSCSDDDDKDKAPDPEVPVVAEGAFVLNQGNMTDKIEGSLTYLDYAKGTASQNVYQNANNGQSIGNTPQGAVLYGSKIYLAIYESNVITIIDRTTFKTIKQISLNSNEGQGPRYLAAKEGKVYVSMYNGYVSRLDTLSLAIDGNVKVGPNPELIAIAGNNLYVPNSDGMNWREGYGTTASVIDIPSFKVAKTITVGLNPTEFHSNGKDVFLLCKGNYADISSKVYRLLPDDSMKEIAEATLMDIKGDKVYLANAPWGTTGADVKYTVYDINTSAMTDMLSDEGVDAPVALAVDPVSGKIIVTSYTIDNGNIGTTLDGYAKEYNANGQFVRRYNVGTGPAFIFFNHH